MTRSVVLNIFLALALAFTACSVRPAGKVTTKSTPEDQKLFFAASTAISRGDRGIGLALLTSPIHYYPKSPFSEQAKLLVFYSLARRDGNGKTRDTAILDEILKIADEYKPTVDTSGY